MNYLQTVRHIPRDAWKLMLVSLTVGIGFFGIHMVLFNLYLLRMGYGPEFIGIFNGVALIASAACAIPAGMAGRRWGPRRAMFSGYAIWCTSNVLLPQAELIPEAWRTPWLMINFIFVWIGVSFWVVNQPPYMVAITSDEERQHTFAMSRAISRFSAVLGSLIAGFLPVFLATQFDSSLDNPAVYRYTLYIGPVLYLIVAPFVWSVRYVEVSHAEPGAPKAAVPYSLFAAMMLFVILAGAAEAAGETYFNVYMDEALRVSPALIGSLVAVAQLLAGVVVLTAPLLVVRFGAFGTILSACVGMGVSAFVLAVAPSWFGAGLGFAGIAVLASVVFPVRTIFHQEITNPEWRSTMSGNVQLASAGGRAAAVIVGGFLITRIGYGGMFAAAAITTLGGAAVFWIFFQEYRRRLAPVPAADRVPAGSPSDG
jgi:MFS family permease